MRSSAGVGQEEEEEESGEEEEEGEKDTFPSWKKTIMIGPSYQASVPSGTTNYDDRFVNQFSTLHPPPSIFNPPHMKIFVSSPPYENEDKQLWDPTRLAEEVKLVLKTLLAAGPSLSKCNCASWRHLKVSREYLAKAAETLPGSTPCGVNGIPVGKHVR